MKTKVIISVSVFLAVALIGLARPQAAAVARENAPVEAATPAVEAVPVTPAAPVQAVQQAPEKQEKDETKPAATDEKQKKIRKAIRIVKGDGGPGDGPVEITVIDGKTKKAIRLDGSVLVIKKGQDGKTVLMSPEGQELAVIEGEGTRLEIKGGKMIRLDDGEDLDLDNEPRVSTEVVGEGEEPEHITIKHVKKGDGEIVVKKRLVIPEPHVSVQVDEPHVSVRVKREELREKLAETQALLKKIEAQKLAESSLAAQQESLKELEHSLQALEEELKKKEESLKRLKVVVEPKILITHEDGELAELEHEEIAEEKEAQRTIIKTTRDKAAYTIMLDMNLKGDPKQAYDKAVAKLEKELPQGFKLEPKLEEKAGMMTIKITAPGGSEEDLKKVQRIVEELQAELGK